MTETLIPISQEGLDRHWRRMYRVQETDFRAFALAKLVEARLVSGRSVLDIGCGAGGLVRKLLRNGWAASGIDVSDEMLAMGRELLSEEGFDAQLLQKSSVDEMAASGSLFPQVVCLDVIEHTENDEAVLANIFKILEPGGRLVLTVPAMPSLYGPKDVELGHYRRYTKRGLKDLMSRQPCSVRELRYWNALGVLPTLISTRIFGKAVNESMRQENSSLFMKASASILRTWFTRVENMLRPPLGLTLLVAADKHR